MPATPLPTPCVLCRSTEGVRRSGALECAVCGWRYGNVPDADLPLPRIDVVYYLRYKDRVKIGTSNRPRSRLAAIWHEELLAFEPGDRHREHERHVQFADLRVGGEWFSASELLLQHAADLRGTVDPWHAYARWFAEAVARTSS